MQEVFFVTDNRPVFTLPIRAQGEFLFPSAFQDPVGIRMFFLGQHNGLRREGACHQGWPSKFDL